MLLLGVAVLSRLFRHGLVDKVTDNASSFFGLSSPASGHDPAGFSNETSARPPDLPGGVPAPSYMTGGPDSGRVYNGGVGGDWAGSLPRALQVAAASRLPVTSQKRTRQTTASGGISDHWVGSTSSYAVDLGTSGAAGDAAYVRVLGFLGLDPAQYPAGRWHNVEVGGYRYQIGWRTPGHFDHIHVGVKRA